VQLNELQNTVDLDPGFSKLGGVKVLQGEASILATYC